MMKQLLSPWGGCTLGAIDVFLVISRGNSACQANSDILTQLHVKTML